MRRYLPISIVLILTTVSVFAQDQRGGSGQMRPGDNVAGKVAAVAADSITVTPLNGGDAVIIKAGENTRIMKDREPVKVSAIKVNDTVFARGNLSGNTLDAFMIAVVNPEMLQRMQQGGGFGMGPGGGQFKAEDWGKTFVAGQLKGINETTLTVSRPDNQQTINIEVDENTSFRKGRESVTLADIKPDDFVFAQGEIKNGVFMVKELRVGGGRMFRMAQPGGPPPDQKKPESDQPAATPKN